MTASQDPYISFAPFYDFLIGDREELPFIQNLLEQHSAPRASLLELACGTGSLLAGLQQEYDVHGLDRCPDMLSVARRKLPGVSFYDADMVDFQLNHTYDVIICCFNSINHILSFRDWKRMFLCVAQHLNPGGFFLFDINTQHGLSLYPDEAPVIIEDESTLGVIRYRHLKKHVISMDVTVFREAQDGSYLRTDTEIQETSFEASRIKDALSLYFKPVQLLDPERSRPGTNSEILYFLCTLRS